MFRFRTLLNSNFTMHSVLSVGAGCCAIMYSAHAIFSDRIANMYKIRGIDGEPLPLRAHIKLHFEDVASDFGLTDWKKKFFHLFVCEGLEPFHLGSTQVSKGVFIGIPRFLQAGNEEEITESKILIDKKPVDWESADGNRLLQSLQWSENAQKFFLAKLILKADNSKFLIDSFLPSFILSGFYCVGSFLHKSLDLLHKPFISSIFVHSVIGGIFILIFLFLNDGVTLAYEKSIEEDIYSKGELYILGGIEYYEKMIERNKALRNLMKNGHKRYSVHGNETNLLRAKGLPDTYKLKIATEMLTKNYEKEYATQIPTPRKGHPVI